MKKGKFKKLPPLSGKKLLAVLLSLVLLAAMGAGASLAYFTGSSEPVINTFELGSVGAKIEESVSNNTKEYIAVNNTGESPVYVRVRLVSYWLDANGNGAPKTAPALNFTHSNFWTKIGDYYYYAAPLAGGATTENLLSSGLAMTIDENGYAQVIEVLADTVQASPAAAVLDVWGINASEFIG